MEDFLSSFCVCVCNLRQNISFQCSSALTLFEEIWVLSLALQESWTNASKKQREKLLELIRRLAEDDKDGVMAHKVLNLLWNLAHSDDVPVDIMDQALSAHIKILDYSCSQVQVATNTVLTTPIRAVHSHKEVLYSGKTV